jgi:hypothetical protein
VRGAAKHVDNYVLSPYRTVDIMVIAEKWLTEKLRMGTARTILSRCLGNYLGELAHPAHYYLGVSSLSRRLERIAQPSADSYLGVWFDLARGRRTWLQHGAVIWAVLACGSD